MWGARAPGTFPPTLLSLSLPAAQRRFQGSSHLRPSVPGRAWGLPTGHSLSTQWGRAGVPGTWIWLLCCCSSSSCFSTWVTCCWLTSSVALSWAWVPTREQVTRGDRG